LKITYLHWDERNTSHIAKHEVDPNEVEEIFRNKPKVRKAKKESYIALGLTDSGRLLFVVF